MEGNRRFERELLLDRKLNMNRGDGQQMSGIFGI